MYSIIVLAPSGEVSPALSQALEQEHISYEVVRELGSSDQLPDAVLLDAASAGEDELRGVMERCHEQSLPVLVVVERQAVASYDATIGADDFISCPPAPGEVTARLRQVLGRSSSQAPEGDVLRVGDLVIDTQRYEVYVAGRKVFLTFKEYQLVKLLAENPGRVFSRETLLNQIWRYDYFGGTRTVDVHIRRLRSKIEDSRHTFIETVWNVGYRFRA